jgi:large subunit ribosomal protein L23
MTTKVKNLELMPHEVVLRPIVTEKSMHRSTRNNQYAFEVNVNATKEDVKKAVEELFNVNVVGIRTQNRKGKPRRHKFKLGRTKSWKKALVTLQEDQSISLF